MADTVTIDRGPWRFVWDGGRLMDIFHAAHPESAVDAIQPGPFDWDASESLATIDSMAESAATWVRDHGQEFIDNHVRYLPYGEPHA